MHVPRTLLLWTVVFLCHLEKFTATADSSSANLSISTRDVSLQKGEEKQFWLMSKVNLEEDAEIYLYSDHAKIATIQPRVSFGGKGVL